MNSARWTSIPEIPSSSYGGDAFLLMIEIRKVLVKISCILFRLKAKSGLQADKNLCIIRSKYDFFIPK